jgi:hypothetical protein
MTVDFNCSKKIRMIVDNEIKLKSKQIIKNQTPWQFDTIIIPRAHAF